MKQVRLGKTELQVTEIGFGGIPIIPLATDKAMTVVKHCYDSGINFFDTANAYVTSEEKIGQALAPVRDRVVIATKTAARDAAEAARHVDLSLRNLQTEWIDLYQLHNVSNDEALEQVLAPGGALEAALRARDAGKIRHIGVTSHSIRIALAALGTGLFETIQFPFNFIEHDPLDELFPFAMKEDIGIIGMKPLGGGMIARADLCFRYLQQYPYVVPIPGVKSPAEIDEIVGLFRDKQRLAEGDLKDMQGIRSLLGEKFCHRCEYCMPCQQGVQIPTVLIFKPAAKRLSRDGVVSWLGKAMESAEACIECGECEEKCPYQLPIADLLKENLALYNDYLRS